MDGGASPRRCAHAASRSRRASPCSRSRPTTPPPTPTSSPPPPATTPTTVCPPHRWLAVPMAPPDGGRRARPSRVHHRRPRRARSTWPEATRSASSRAPAACALRSPTTATRSTSSRALAPDVVLVVADAGLGTINAVRLDASTRSPPFPVVVALNRYDDGDDLHRANRDWLVDPRRLRRSSPTPASSPPAGPNLGRDMDAAHLSELARRHLWMHFSRLGLVRRRPPGPDHRAAARAAGSRTSPGTATSTACPASSPCSSGTVGADLAAAAAKPGRDARVLPDLDVRAPARDRARGAPRRARARRPQPRVLHQRRVGGGGVGVEARAPVLPRHRAGSAAQGDRPPRRVPRHDARCARHHRRPRAARPVRAAHARRCARGQHRPHRPPARARREGVHARGHRRDRGRDPVRGPRDRGRGVPRAGAERGRLLHATRRLLRARARDLRQATACCSCPTR